ncbi:cytidine and deoxycytidylate deaminase zinc-binding region [Leptospira broomii serovar Hurstbridge str. 5399]|uniref:Cytidine and deoxycytidylate deaminase zinc-binding region n=1 Tax=Leptospira broomii serovar Hurstbridge str. 5399 TaxID=1049789 RepID=T0FCH4_9LEPT|nr:nucleoside deaminase [Leptospira broomii]EQA45556.1 cytidine and deoxycytidylate deaminase zinc-binding region [Leptospira broomii serovar Hurstbridge str. 5399]
MDLNEILPYLPEFLERFHDLRPENRDEIPSFTRIYKNSVFLCEASNLVEVSQDSSRHSEIIAIAKAKELLRDRYLTDCLLITTLEPCLMCAGTILLSRIPKVAYLLPAKQGEGISSLSFETIYSRNFFPDLLLIRTEETRISFQEFFHDKRN